MNETEQKKVLFDILESMKNDGPVLIGFSSRGPENEPFEIKRWGQFIVKFGSFKKCGFLATSANGFFLNGGRRCYILNLGERPRDIDDVKVKFMEGLKFLDGLSEIPFIAAPGEDDPSLHNIITDYCGEKGTFALLDGPEELIEKVIEVQEDEILDEGEEGVGAEELPQTGRDSSGTTEMVKEEETEKFENLPELKSNNGTIIYPWIYLKDRMLGDFFIPPTGHVAGILCRLFNDKEKPEFSTIEGTILLKYKFSPEEIDEYKARGMSPLKYPTKKPGLMLV
jgi:hypothetical protein